MRGFLVWMWILSCLSAVWLCDDVSSSCLPNAAVYHGNRVVVDLFNYLRFWIYIDDDASSKCGKNTSQPSARKRKIHFIARHQFHCLSGRSARSTTVRTIRALVVRAARELPHNQLRHFSMTLLVQNEFSLLIPFRELQRGSKQAPIYEMAGYDSRNIVK